MQQMIPVVCGYDWIRFVPSHTDHDVTLEVHALFLVIWLFDRYKCPFVLRWYYDTYFKRDT